MTGTASILPRTIAALTALLLAAGLFAWMNATGDGIGRVSDTFRNNAAASQVFWSWIESVKPESSQTEAPLVEHDFIQPEDAAPIIETGSVWQFADEEEAEEVENPFGLISCFYPLFWIDWALWARFVGPFLAAGAITFFLAVNKGLLRGGRQLEGA